MITGKFIKSGDDCALIYDIRRRVFVEEQGYSAEGEIDSYDQMSIYALVCDEDGTPGAAGRLFIDGDNIPTIGRVAVLKDMRGRGLGDLVMRMLLFRVQEMELPRVKVSAQVPAIGFYERYGLQPVGDTYVDEGVPHQMLVAELAQIDISGSCKHCHSANEQ